MSYLTNLTKQKLAAIVQVSLNPNGHNEVTIKFVRHDGDAQRWRNATDATVNGWYIDNLSVRAWWSSEYPEINYGSMYDSINYSRPYRVTLSGAEATFSTLKRIDTKLSKITATDGYTSTFGEYVLRICKVMGIKTFLIPRSPKASGYDQMELHPVDAAIFRDHINFANKSAE